MNTLEVLTLLLVVFAALSYIDNHNKKKQHPQPSQSLGCYSYKHFNTEGKSASRPIRFLSRLYTRAFEKSSALFRQSNANKKHISLSTCTLFNSKHSLDQITFISDTFAASVTITILQKPPYLFFAYAFSTQYVNKSFIQSYSKIAVHYIHKCDINRIKHIKEIIIMNNLQTHIENYLKYGHTQKCLDEKTLKAYRIDLNQFSQQTSLQDITKITSNTLEQYISLLHSNYKPKTAKRKIASLISLHHFTHCCFLW